ncbi:hypothetical protein Bca4012_052550 [Brassica carinata]
MVKFDAKLWKAVFTMSIINIALSVVNVMFKKMLDQGINRMVATTYRLAAGTLFLIPFAIFMERQETLNIKSKIGRAKVLGTMICVCGALVLTLYKGPALTRQNAQMQTQTSNGSTTSVTQKWAVGSVMLIISILIWSLWFIVQGKICRTYPCKYTTTTILSFFGVIQSALLSLISEKSISMWVLKERFQVLSLLYSGIVGSGLCYVGVSWCLQQRGPVFTSSFIPLIQVFAAFFSFSFLHEQIYCGSKDKPAPVTKQEHLNLDLEGCGTAPNELNGAAHPVSEK